MLESFSLGPFLGGAFMALLGATLLKHAIQSFKDFESSKNWPSVKGRMLSSKVWRPQSTSSHRVWSIEYQYKVNDEQYTGNRAALYTPVFEEIQQWQEGRQEGDEVMVYYDPAVPHKSVLVVGGRAEKRGAEIILCIGAIIIGLAVMVCGGFLGYLS